MRLHVHLTKFSTLINVISILTHTLVLKAEIQGSINAICVKSIKIDLLTRDCLNATSFLYFGGFFVFLMLVYFGISMESGGLLVIGGDNEHTSFGLQSLLSNSLLLVILTAALVCIAALGYNRQQATCAPAAKQS